MGETATAEVQHAELTLWLKQISSFTIPMVLTSQWNESRLFGVNPVHINKPVKEKDRDRLLTNKRNS